MRSAALFFFGLCFGFFTIWMLKFPAPHASQISDPEYSIHIGKDHLSQGKLHEEVTQNLLTFQNEDLNPAVMNDLYQSNIQEILVRKSLVQSLLKKLSPTDLRTFQKNCKHEWLNTKNLQHQDSSILRDRFCEEKLIQTHFTQNIEPQINITTQNLQDYYNSHLSEFKTGSRVLIRHILVKKESLARKIHAKLNRKNFSQLAQKYSEAPEAEDGGRIGPFTHNELPSSLNIAFHMKEGHISKILSSTYGYHMITLDKRLEKGTKSFDEVKDSIRNTLLQQEREKEYRRWLQLSLQSIKIKTHTSTNM
ncbi:MAG: peptidylprolyl isomerase [Oligoflexales bacterium]